MQRIGTISAEQFMLHFYEEIRVPIDWKALVEAKVCVDYFEVESRCDLGGLYTVWGMKEDGAYIQNHSLRVMDKFSKECEERLCKFSKEILSLDVVILAAPAYECCCGKYVLLDRTHRSIYLYRKDTANFRMIMYAIPAQFVSQRPENCIQCATKAD